MYLVGVAWYQLRGMNETAKADFLLRIADRFGRHEIVQARKVIHEFYCEKRSDQSCVDAHIDRISKKIKEIGTDKEKAEDFILLLTFLEFLDTTAYFCKKGYLSKTDIEELVSGSMTYYYKVFKAWIYYRRQKYNDNRYYCELENLVDEINRRQRKL